MLFLSDFNGTCIFSTDFYKKAPISNLIKIHPTGAEFFHVDGHNEALVVFAIWGTLLKTHSNQINHRMAINAYIIALLTYSCGITS